MKYLLTVALAALAVPAISAANPDWENPAKFAEGRLAPRATAYPYATTQAAAEGNYTQSPYFLSLNGKWKFKYSAKPADRPADFYKTD